jgi:hypothetical protein
VADVFLNLPADRRSSATDAVNSTGEPNGAAVYTLSDAEINAVAGLYRNSETGAPLTIARTDAGLRVENGALLRALSASRFALANGGTLEIDARGRVRMADRFGSIETYERASAARPTATELASYAGTYLSDEAEASLIAAVDAETLVLKRRPASTIRLTPVYKDAFRGSIGLVQFRRDAAGRVTSFSVSQDRVWDLRFTREGQVP